MNLVRTSGELVPLESGTCFNAELNELFERMVRPFDSTALWIDTDGVRRWTSDGDTWNCVGWASPIVCGDLNDVPGRHN